MQRAMGEVWGVSRKDRPGFPLSWLCQLALLSTLLLAAGIGFVLTAFFSGVAGSEGYFLTGGGAHIGAIVVSLVLNAGMFWLSLRFAAVRRAPWNVWCSA